METKKKIKTTVVMTINEIDILASIEDDELVPIRPICDLFGIDSKAQRDKLNSNPLYSLVGGLSTSTGADGKLYEMYCLPFEYCLAWMLEINSANVKLEIREKLLDYQRECVLALKEHFYGKYRKREKSLEESAKLEVEKQLLIDKENKSDDFKRYLEIEKEQKEKKGERSKSSRKAFADILSLFSQKEMTGK